MADLNAYGLFCVDPGRTTGIAKGIVNCAQPTVAATLRRARNKGLLQAYELKGEWYQQGWLLARSYFDWVFELTTERSLVPLPNVKFIIENFEIRDIGADFTPLRIVDSTETLIRGGLEGPQPGQLLADNPTFDQRYIKQRPGDQQFATDEMLRNWQLWRSSPHERSALKHMAKRIDRILEGER